MNSKLAPVPFLPFVALSWVGCVSGGASEETKEGYLPVTVRVDLAEVLEVVPPYAYGIHASLYDNNLHDPDLKQEIDEAGISLLRWPGGGYSDNYHFANHEMTPWSDGNRGHLAQGSDFGGFVAVLDRLGREAMITVNYGSNQTHDGPGEPKEAAAWVAYANGDPNDETVIGEDSTGYDWQTVGFWASLRASDPLDDDDGYNFLRISRPESVDIEYWEVGNEVFGNGYYVNNSANYSENGADVGFELDMHVPYDGTNRYMNEALSPSSYGAGVVDYVREMKAVDPSIKVGAVLVTPPEDYSWAPTWNQDVLSQCGDVVDFGIIHWYPRGNLLTKSAEVMDEMFEILEAEIDEHVAEPDSFEITVTELGPPPGYGDTQARVMGLFAADAYLSFIEHGATNVDWLELHNGTFLDERATAPGRAYYGIQLAHRLAAPSDRLVFTEASRIEVRAHASVRQDGSFSVMLINTSAFRTTEITLEVPGAALSGTVQMYSSSEERAPEPPTDPEATRAQDGRFTIVVSPETLALVEMEAE